MELIQKIKAAEAQAQQIIEQAQSDAKQLAEKGFIERQEQLDQARQERNAIIEKSVASAMILARTEAEELASKSQQHREQLCKKAAKGIERASEKVMDYLKG